MSEEATIRRGVRNARYTTVPNHVFEDVRLSMEARWLLGYLLSKPDNWTVILGDIARRGGCGRDKARKIVNELVKHGYADKEQEREDGRFGKLSLVIFDEPRELRDSAAGEGVASLPQTENPSTVMPSTVNPTLVNT
ncbi:helix-turn-helix domain-containing protein, partial [Mesorhizobium sp. M7A.F.Ca.CA.004.11.2.1]